MNQEEAAKALLASDWIPDNATLPPSQQRDFKKGAQQIRLGTDSAGRVDKINYSHRYLPGQGRFEPVKLREEIIARYGSPFQEGRSNTPELTINLAICESPYKSSYEAFMKASIEQRNMANLAPAVLVNLTEQGVSLQFHWNALQKQASDSQLARERTIQQSAPTKSLDLGK
jgi:hypothetical protein